ncbi:MAG: hypothetical protein KC413_11025, partial [Anaerolineales bacterium]|nr:hypothetical protein [Anaerolineales bacterium]
PSEEIVIDEYEPGTMKVVEMPDGSYIQLRKLDEDYDPTDKLGALHRLQWAQQNHEFITGLVYYNPHRPNLAEVGKLVDTPLAYLPAEKLRPPKEKLDEIMAELM